jgi:hypothetical protein
VPAAILEEEAGSSRNNHNPTGDPAESMVIMASYADRLLIAASNLRRGGKRNGWSKLFAANIDGFRHRCEL